MTTGAGIDEGPGRYLVALGTHVFDPLDTESERRTRRVQKPARTDGTPDPADTRIVQFHRILPASDVERIRVEHGLALTAYIPELAYVERLDDTSVRRLRNDPLVRAVCHYFPRYKLSPDLDVRSRRPGDGLLDVTASLFDGGSTRVVEDLVVAEGAKEVRVVDDRPLGGLARVRFVVPDMAVIERVADLDDVRGIEPTPRPKLDTLAAASVNQSGSETSHPIWDKGLHGEGQIIWVMDGGPVDIAHCFFADASPNMPGPGHRKIIAITNTSASALSAHGTFVAGCAAGDERVNSGAHANRGSAWAARLYCTNYNEPSFLAELNAGFAAGARVFTNSWHDGTHGAGNPSPYTQACVDADTFTFTNEDAIVLGSSGNAGEEQGPPGSAKNVMMVSAAQSGSNPTAIGDGNSGPTLDGRRKPDIVSVGCGISSATVSTPCGVGPRSPCATSYATPLAAGAATLVRQYFLEGWYPTGIKTAANAFSPTGSLVKATLVNSAVDLTGVPGFPNSTEGWGLIRLDRALYFDGGRRKNLVWDVRHAAGPTQGDNRTHTVKVEKDTEELRIVLVWAEPPGTSLAADPVINDLDLTATSPSGASYTGNDFVGGFTPPDTGQIGDLLNNIEVVLVANPEAGDWRINVRAFRIATTAPGGGQGYAVIANATTKSDCFVASTVYGDPDHPDVDALRAWRNRGLRGGGARAAAMHALGASYAVLGPPAARIVARFPRLRALLRERVLSRLARRVDASQRGES
ncbi:S8 family serine peptidase [Kocuria kalidii]|uniref:S8 family serine peptidase n=1 Tax=Kocuria kalidii TaxID=3376283 RepID=UPI0037A578CD